MKTVLNTLRDKAAQYGWPAMTDAELIKIAKLPEDFKASQQFQAVKELIRRDQVKELKQIKKSSDIFELFSFLSDYSHEEFHVCYLNRANKVIKTEMLSRGSECGTVVSVKAIIKGACELKASGVVLIHNHPSGQRVASEADKTITRKVSEALKLVDTQLIDHVIICGNSFYSFIDEGKL